MKTASFTFALIVILSFAQAYSNAEFLTFDPVEGNTGDWDDGDHWRNLLGQRGRKPGPNDNAQIPLGKTCFVQEENQQAAQVTVEFGGTLRIAGKDLRLGGGASVIRGLIELVADGPTPPTLTINGTVTVPPPGGTIRGDPGSGAEIRRSGPNSPDLLLNSSVTISGAIKIKVSIINDGAIQATAAADDIQIGLDVSEDGMRLRVPLGYGVAEGQRYELRSHRPGEPAGLGFGVVGSRWATVVHTRILVGQDEHHLDVGVVLDEAHSSLTWTPGGAGFAAGKTPS